MASNPCSIMENCKSFKPITNGMIEIDIQDQGKGMTEEQINRLGEPYFTTKEKGTGLGMMVSYSIIKGMNGTIRCDKRDMKKVLVLHLNSRFLNKYDLSMKKRR